MPAPTPSPPVTGVERRGPFRPARLVSLRDRQSSRQAAHGFRLVDLIAIAVVSVLVLAALGSGSVLAVTVATASGCGSDPSGQTVRNVGYGVPGQDYSRLNPLWLIAAETVRENEERPVARDLVIETAAGAVEKAASHRECPDGSVEARRRISGRPRA